MQDDREHRIRERAHALWEQAGRPEGRHDEHWRQASQEIGEGSGQQQGGTSGPEEPSLKGLEPAPGESLEEIAKGEHQGP
jgi:hypothetical protein